MNWLEKRKTFLQKFSFALIVLLLVFPIFYFPGQQFSIALTLATGLRRQTLQSQIDKLEKKAILNEIFSEEEKEFLTDLYTSMIKGARLTWVLRQTADMMERYLSRSGEDLQTEPRIFVENAKVSLEMKKLVTRAIIDMEKGGNEKIFTSERFYMPDASSPDSVFGLYWGKIALRIGEVVDGKHKLYWRAEVPWIWPSYAELQEKYGDSQAESFPLPNVLSVLAGPEYAIYVDNGLGEYLTKLNLAKSFTVFSTWESFEVLQ